MMILYELAYHLFPLLCAYKENCVEARRAADPSSDAVGDDRGATATDVGAPDGGLPSAFSPAP